MKIQAVTPDLELNMAGSTVVIADSSGKIRFGFLPLFLFFCPSLFISELSFFCSYFMLLLLLLLFFWFFLGLGIDCILTNWKMWGNLLNIQLCYLIPHYICHLCHPFLSWNIKCELNLLLQIHVYIWYLQLFCMLPIVVSSTSSCASEKTPVSTGSWNRHQSKSTHMCTLWLWVCNNE